MKKQIDIYSILTSKREMLLSVGDPLAVDFTLQEINILSDLVQLRLLKLKTPFSADYVPSENMFDCARKVIEESDLYRTLEFCTWKNRVLIPNVTQVFSRLRKDQ